MWYVSEQTIQKEQCKKSCLYCPNYEKTPQHLLGLGFTSMTEALSLNECAGELWFRLFNRRLFTFTAA